MDEEAGLLELTVGPGKTLPERMSLIPDDYVAATPIKEAVLRVATTWLDGHAIPRAVEDLLFRRPPRIDGHLSGELVPPGDDFVPRVIDVITRLNTTTLCVQGPRARGPSTISVGRRACAGTLARGA